MVSVETHREQFDYWARVWTHARDSHTYGDFTEQGFVPCGHTECAICKAHTKQMQSPLVLEGVGSPTEQGMDVWEMEDGENIVAVLKPRVINTLRAMVEQGEAVTIEQVVDAYIKAVESDCVEIATHHLGQILYLFDESEFVTIMKAIAAVDTAAPVYKGAQA